MKLDNQDGHLCGTCNACCRQWDLIVLDPQKDDPSLYEHQVIIDPNGRKLITLKHQANGDCVYLNRSKGCTIHGDAPSRCREMDCRSYFLLAEPQINHLLAMGLLTEEKLEAAHQCHLRAVAAQESKA